MGRRVAWIGLSLTYIILLRASELSTKEDSRVHTMYCLRRGDVVFYAGERRVKGGNSLGVYTA